MVVPFQRASPPFWNSNHLAVAPWLVDLCIGAASPSGSMEVMCSETAMGRFGTAHF